MRILQWFLDAVSMITAPDSFGEPVHWPTSEKLETMSFDEIVDWVRSTHFRNSDKQRVISALTKAKHYSKLGIEETLPM